MTTHLLEVRDLGRQSEGTWLLREISFSLQTGKLMVVMGPSGSGKSTLLRMLNRLDEPSSGSILLDGVDITTLPPQSLRRRVGMVMQSPHLFPETVADNIRFGPLQRGKQLSDEDVERLLSQVGLAGFGERSIKKLSGGEAARVSLARTLANEPELLLLDEPTAALDEAMSREIEALIAGLLQENGYTAIWITHHVEQAKRLAEQVLLLDQGRCKALGGVELLQQDSSIHGKMG
ncbi:MAG: ATP-binding cassette domain-containing protein [Myxococcales bacterium]|nr:ATP-binding cassette domain-containing protein [Myxococcales bacterium]MCB9641693.1 ATP-binding cassette domain-containing protein [Myxococcales bacterium]